MLDYLCYTLVILEKQYNLQAKNEGLEPDCLGPRLFDLLIVWFW